MRRRIISAFCAVIVAFSTLPIVAACASDYVKRGASEIGVAFIEAFEGYYSNAYWDYEHYTIGYGTTCEKDEYPGGISEEQAHELLKKVLPSYESGLNSFLKENDIYVTKNQYDALLSFTYNFGAYVWNREPTIAKYLKNGISKYTDKQIADAFGLWVKAGGQVLPGLVERRAAEAKLFCTNDFLPNQETLVLTDNTNVRTGAGTGYSSVGTIKRGTVVKVLAKKLVATHIWGKISYGGNDRWLAITSAKYGAVANTSSTLYKPCLYNVENVSTGISLKWTKVHNATGYKIYRKRSDSADFSLYKTITDKDTASFTDKSVSNSSYYVYCIESYNKEKTSSKSGYTSIYFVKSPDLKSTERLSNGIKIHWNSLSGSSGYYIMRRPSTDSYYSKIGSVGSGTTSYSDTSAKGGVKYYYSVKAHNSKGISGFEGGISNMFISAPKITSSYNNSKELKITWNKSYNASGYYIYRKTSSNGSYSKIATVNGGNNISYLDKKVSLGKTYYYSVKAYNSSISSVYGSTFNAKMLKTIKPKSISNTADGFKLSWNKTSAASSYDIHRALKGGSYSKIATVSGSSYTDKKAVSGKTYYYKLSLNSGASKSNTGATVNGTYYAATKINSANAVSGGIKISYSKKSGATGYSIYKVSGSKTSLLGKTTSTSFTDKTATKVGKYSYKVTVNYKTKSSAKSGTFTATKLSTPKLKATTSGGSVKLSWGKVSSATSYILYRKAPSESKYSNYKTVKGTSFNNTTVSKGKSYSYSIKAVNGKSYSIMSSAKTIKVK